LTAEAAFFFRPFKGDTAQPRYFRQICRDRQKNTVEAAHFLRWTVVFTGGLERDRLWPSIHQDAGELVKEFAAEIC